MLRSEGLKSCLHVQCADQNAEAIAQNRQVIWEFDEPQLRKGRVQFQQNSKTGKKRNRRRSPREKRLQ